MSKKLIVIESPGKVGKISSFLGSNYIVLPTIGHITKIPEKPFSIDLETLKATYIFNPKKSTELSKIYHAFKNQCGNNDDNVYLATDPDRAGERISNDVANYLKIKNPQRIRFNEITKNAILNAINSYTQIDKKMVSAQKTQESLDYLCGLKLSSRLSQCLNTYALSAGRCISVYTKLVYEKYQEREKFLKNNDCGSEFNIDGIFNMPILQKPIYDNKNTYDEPQTETVLIMDDTALTITETNSDNSNNSDNSEQKTIDAEFNAIFSLSYDDKKYAMNILKKCMHRKFIIKDVICEEKHMQPQAPFTTLDLQKEASKLLGFSAKTTMSFAQKLYEKGKISYIRTDSVQLPEEVINEIKKYINDKYPSYSRPKQYTTNAKNAQEGHSAIYPIHINEDVIAAPDGEIKLYNLIKRHTLASQMKPEILNCYTFKIIITHDNNSTSELPLFNCDEYFSTTLKSCIYDGYRVLYNKNKNYYTDKSLKKIVNDMNVDNKKIVLHEDHKKSPSQYSESTFISKVKKLGIGRPSTLATLIDKMQKKGYVEKNNIQGILKNVTTIILENNKITEKKEQKEIGSENNKFLITRLGIKTTEFLNKYFVEIMNYDFTAKMEKDLDKIERGKLTYQDVLSDFYNIFKQELLLTDSLINTISNKIIICNYNGIDVTLNDGKYGKYLTYDTQKISLKELTDEEIENLNENNVEKILNICNNGIGEYNGKKIERKIGRYGVYAIYGGKNISLPKKKDVYTDDEIINYIKCLENGENNIGNYEDHVIEKKTGRYGIYYTWNGVNINTGGKEETLDNIINIIKSKQALKVIDKFKILNGRYGLYIKDDTNPKNIKNYKLPQEYKDKIDTITLNDIETIISLSNNVSKPVKYTSKKYKKK